MVFFFDCFLKNLNWFFFFTVFFSGGVFAASRDGTMPLLESTRHGKPGSLRIVTKNKFNAVQVRLEKSEEEKVELQQQNDCLKEMIDQSEMEKAELRRQNDCLQERLADSERGKYILHGMLEKSEEKKDKFYQERNHFQTLADNEVVKNSKLIKIIKNQGTPQAVLDQKHQLKRENEMLLARINDLEQCGFLHSGIREISHLSRELRQLHNNFCKLTLNETSNGIGIHHWYGIPKETSSILRCGGCGECIDCKRIILKLIKPINEVVKVGLFQGELCTRDIYGVVEGLCFSASDNVELKIEKWGRGIKIRSENIECLGTQFSARLKIIMPKRQERQVDLLYNVDVKGGDGCEVSVFKMEGSDRGKEVISKNKIYGRDREIRDYKVEEWLSPECQYIEMSWRFRFRQAGDTLFIGYPVILLDGSLVDIGQSAEYKFLDLISVDQHVLELKNVPKKLVKKARSSSDIGEELKSHLVFVDYKSRRVIDKECFKLNVNGINGKDSLGVLVNGVLDKVIVMTDFTDN